MENFIARILLHLYMHPTPTAHIDNNGLIGVLMGFFLENVLLSSIHYHTATQKSLGVDNNDITSVPIAAAGALVHYHMVHLLS